jgi:hypothetical protein
MKVGWHRHQTTAVISFSVQSSAHILGIPCSSNFDQKSKNNNRERWNSADIYVKQLQLLAFLFRNLLTFWEILCSSNFDQKSKKNRKMKTADIEFCEFNQSLFQ